ncbi:hypothetical protein D9757_000978 [Collybiopsis confluens]|uniref:F-box domain-containing protein n=1 Tax=Collybiopsis confluens TaxID=2823264 RepID=A0A8H5MG57_9AGAR|nr:hypothetical protein D9757_000978 [Collybiopsis confluens]
MSPSYAGLSSPIHIFSLPFEVVEQIIVACASSGAPESIASFSQSCQLYFELIYGSSDSHLWREIYMATFDDPRRKLNILNRPIGPNADAINYDWKNEFQRRVRAKKMFRTSRTDVRPSAAGFTALSSLVNTSPPQLPGTYPENHESANISWINQVFSNGFPPTLLRRLTLNKSNASADSTLSASLPIAEQIIMRPDWERSDMGRAFYNLFFLSGFRVVSENLEEEEEEGVEERYRLRSSSLKQKKEAETSKMSESRQRELARTVARHRVYHLPYLSKERCWGPFLRANSPPPSVDKQDLTPPTSPLDKSGQGKGKEKVVEDGKATTSKISRRSSSTLNKNESNDVDEDQYSIEEETENVQVDMSFIRAILTNFYSGLPHQGHESSDEEDDNEENDPDFIMEAGHSHHHHEELDEDYHDEEEATSDSESVSFYTDDGSEPSLDLFAPASGPFPIYPPFPHLLFPDYAFLSAARLVVTENLRERYGHGSASDAPIWPWFTTVSAVEATREILLRMGVSLPPRPSDSESAADSGAVQKDGVIDGTVADEKGNVSVDRTMRSWDSLRMGSAPGFWEARGTREGWTGEKDSGEDEREQPEVSEPWKKDESLEYVDGWDWAGAEGQWMRAVCWMDYRDLLFHNLQSSYPLAARYHQEIQETCRVFPMSLKVVGFSRVQPPNALPSCSASSSSPSTSSTNSKGKEKSKGKGKSKEKERKKDAAPIFPSGSYDPLVYILPVIHIEGEFRGSDVDETAARRARGTIRMIGDRAVRWNLISSEISSPDRDEWVMEGVQVGGIGSAMGVIGMWTGASHERGDPIGPSWAWKIE